ncbi:unnamed protein product, partial [Laminaria digitata]
AFNAGAADICSTSHFGRKRGRGPRKLIVVGFSLPHRRRTCATLFFLSALHRLIEQTLATPAVKAVEAADMAEETAKPPLERRFNIMPPSELPQLAKVVNKAAETR